MNIVMDEMEGKQESFGDSYYQKCCDGDVISRLRPLLMSAGYHLRPIDGKICATQQGIAWDTPWHHIHHDAFLDCLTWHTVIFNLISRLMPSHRQFVPSACQQCWKVVVRPKTLFQLFALVELQKALCHPSKCGIEVRPTVHASYGGYFYNHSLGEGLACYKMVRDAIDNDENLGPDVAVFLKRACTEYEALCGDSSKWEITPEQIHIETLVNKWFVRDTAMLEQPAHAIMNVHRKWIEFAYERGDETYLKFTDGVPLYKPYKTYHELLELSEEELQAELDKYKMVYPYGYIA